MKAQIFCLFLAGYSILKVLQRFLIRNESNLDKDSTSTGYQNSPTAVWLLYVSLLTKVEHLPLIAAQLVLEEGINRVCLNESKRDGRTSFVFRAIIYVYMAMCSFANLGNTNSLSTLDVSAGFIGLSEYNLVIVSVQMICSTYSTVVFWLMMLVYRLDRTLRASGKQKSQFLMFIFSVRLLFLIYFQVVAYILINHLFIWSVITPKLLYEFALTELFELFLVYAMIV